MHTVRSLVSMPLYWFGVLVGLFAAPFVKGFMAGFSVMSSLREKDLMESEAEARKRGWMK